MNRPLVVALSFFASVASVGAFAVLGTACTSILGDFEVGAGAEDVDGATPTDGSTPNDASPVDAGADVDATAACVAPEVACGPVCVNLDTSAEHCGKCGRVCGTGATCTDGKCSVATIAGSEDLAVESFDVGATEVFFSNPPTKLLACPKDGCTGAPRIVGQTQYGFHDVHVASGTVLFQSAPVQNTERPAAYGCPLSGCPGVLSDWVSDGLSGFVDPMRARGGAVGVNGGSIGLVFTTCSAGACAKPPSSISLKGAHGFDVSPTDVFFVDAASRGGAIATCPQTAGACTPKVVVNGDLSDVESVVFADQKLFWLRKGADGANAGKLLMCDLALDCKMAGNVKTIVNGLDSPRGLVVDATGYFWVTAAGKIQACAPGACVGGARDPVPSVTGASHLVSTPDHLYWLAGQKIQRIAK